MGSLNSHKLRSSWVGEPRRLTIRAALSVNSRVVSGYPDLARERSLTVVLVEGQSETI